MSKLELKKELLLVAEAYMKEAYPYHDIKLSDVFFEKAQAYGSVFIAAQEMPVNIVIRCDFKFPHEKNFATLGEGQKSTYGSVMNLYNPNEH